MATGFSRVRAVVGKIDIEHGTPHRRMVLPTWCSPHVVTPDRLLRNSKLLHPTNCVSLYSKHRTCVLVLMQVLGALFECQGCVPPHIRKERLRPSLTAVLVAQAALPSLVARTQSAHARGSFVQVPMKPQSGTRHVPRLIAESPPARRASQIFEETIICISPLQTKPVQLRIAI